MAIVAELDSRTPPISSWEVHVLQPWAHVDDLKQCDDISGYHRDVYEDGKAMGTEWNPQLQEKMTQHLYSIGVKSVKWHRVLQRNYINVLASIPHTPSTVLFNLCDGQEARGWVGYSVIRSMERMGFAFTGASSHIYSLDETKAKMKKHLVAVQASTPSYLDLTDVSESNKDDIIAALGRLQMPILVKPSESSSSVGLTDKSVCHSAEEAWRVACDISAKHGPVYVEEFIAGREYTVFCSGSAAFGVTAHLALERVFNKSLPSTEQFLSFETKWERWQSHWWYAPAPAEVQARAKQAAIDTYIRAGCNGYCRFDLREDARDGKIYAVDVNVNCSLDVDDETALQILLGAEGTPMCALLESLLRFAFRRREAEKLQLKPTHFAGSLSTNCKQALATELQPPKVRLEQGTD